MRRRPGHRAPRRPLALGVTAALTAGLLAAVVPVTTGSVQAQDRWTAVRSAASYATARGYTVGIAVHDSVTGKDYTAGSTGTFASESLIKVFIAARLIHQGRMHGTTATRAAYMIRRSDDGIANSFYGSVGGDGLLSWAERYYKVGIGSGPIRSNWWGSNRITARGLVKAYAKLRADKRVGPWLLKAMHGHTVYGSDGFYQDFGIPQAARDVAVKQGWGADYSYSTPNASMNTTGFVNSDRYIVVILGRGPASSYGSRLGNLLTAVAKRVLPGGAFPADNPQVSTLSARTGPVGGGTAVTLHGRDFTGVSAVSFGGYPARFRVVDSRTITATAPRQPGARAVAVYVITNHGVSSKTAPVFTYVGAPAITAMSSHGPLPPGSQVTITGVRFTGVQRVLFGPYTATGVRTVSSTTITVLVPAGTGGTANVRVVTAYGVSPLTTADRFALAPPSTAVARTGTAGTTGTTGTTAPADPPTSPATTTPGSTAPASTAPASTAPASTTPGSSAPASTTPADPATSPAGTTGP